MPSTNHQCTTHLPTDKPDLPSTTPMECSRVAVAAHADWCNALSTVNEHCIEERHTDAYLPVIRLPSSLSEITSFPTAAGPALVSTRSSGGITSESGVGVCVTPYMPPFGSSSKAERQRRTLDARQTANPSLQAVLSLAAKVRSPLHTSAVYNGDQARGRGRAQSKVSRGKAGQGMASTCWSSSGKGKTIGDTGPTSQSSHVKISCAPVRYGSIFLSDQGWQMCPCSAQLVLGTTKPGCEHHLLHQ